MTPARNLCRPPHGSGLSSQSVKRPPTISVSRDAPLRVGHPSRAHLLQEVGGWVMGWVRSEPHSALNTAGGRVGRLTHTYQKRQGTNEMPARGGSSQAPRAPPTVPLQMASLGESWRTRGLPIDPLTRTQQRSRYSMRFHLRRARKKALLVGEPRRTAPRPHPQTLYLLLLVLPAGCCALLGACSLHS